MSEKERGDEEKKPSPNDQPTRVYLEGPPLSRMVASAPAPPGQKATRVTLPRDALPATRAMPPMTGRYEAVRELGEGGMGRIQECLDHELSRHVARKSLRESFATDPRAWAVLEREARIIGKLEHPSIIPVYDAGKQEDGRPYYVMRLLQERSLEDVLEELRHGLPSTIAEFGQNRLLRAFIQVCQAAHYAHTRGILHCDLKPANVLLGSFGEVLVVDWGLAHKLDEAPRYRGGTFAFMAPEQFDPERLGLDARTDVFALGAILYEMLTLESAFDGSKEGTVQAGRPSMPLGRRAVPPAERAPHRKVPDELADACMRALEPAKDARFESAQELAEAVEMFLEGKRERERRDARAAARTTEGDELADAYLDLAASRPERVSEMNDLRARALASDLHEDREALRDAEDRGTVMDALGIRSFQSAVRAYEQALEDVPHHPGARKGLARLYRAELSRAELRRDDFDRAYFQGLVRQYDDEPASTIQGSVELVVRPAPTIVTLCHLEERGRKLVETKEELLGPAPVRVPTLAAGSYVARLHRSGFPDVTYPFLVRGALDLSLPVDTSGAVDAKPDEVFVPGGPALLGGDELNLLGKELQEVQVGPFLIARYPVSFAEYFEFLSAIYRDDHAEAERHLPMADDGARLWDWSGEQMLPAWITRFGDDIEYLESLPVFGINFLSAEAYAKWRSETTGRSYRLPTDFEWEKAARGADGRRYPWGDRFEASFCKCRETRAELPHPEPSGTYAGDTSPYGVRDLAGGVSDWVVPVLADDALLTHVASRGGAWCDWRVDCQLAARRPYLMEERSVRVGFRLVRTARTAELL